MQKELVVTDRDRTALKQLIKAAEIMKKNEERQLEIAKKEEESKGKDKHLATGNQVVEHAILQNTTRSQFKLNVIPTEIESESNKSIHDVEQKKKKKRRRKSYR